MKQFVNDTHLHGVKELYYAPKFFKFVWITIILCSTGLCVFETYKVVQEYIETKPVTQISTKAPEKFPPVLFCPSDWQNETAIAELGISETMLIVGLGYLPEFSAWIIDEHPLVKAATENLSAVESDFNAMLKNKFDNEIDVSLKNK